MEASASAGQKSLENGDFNAAAAVTATLPPATMPELAWGDYTKVTHPHAKRERMVNVTRRATN
ncbi:MULTISPECIES: hypothetical protein [Sphingobium]|uniref:hypothetical protein n=1 Tax=Sphingobium TaxID=165695 RepID=UPI0011D17884|nr:hypothetical protein [Sphingobium indicum]